MPMLLPPRLAEPILKPPEAAGPQIVVKARCVADVALFIVGIAEAATTDVGQAEVSGGRPGRCLCFHGRVSVGNVAGPRARLPDRRKAAQRRANAGSATATADALNGGPPSPVHSESHISRMASAAAIAGVFDQKARSIPPAIEAGTVGVTSAGCAIAPAASLTPATITRLWWPPAGLSPPWPATRIRPPLLPSPPMIDPATIRDQLGCHRAERVWRSRANSVASRLRPRPTPPPASGARPKQRSRRVDSGGNTGVISLPTFKRLRRLMKGHTPVVADFRS